MRRPTTKALWDARYWCITAWAWPAIHIGGMPKVDWSMFDNPPMVRVNDDGTPVSAEYAKARLKREVARDREAAQDGRWVLYRHGAPEELIKLLQSSLCLFGAPPSWPAQHGKPHYRWQPRR